MTEQTTSPSQLMTLAISPRHYKAKYLDKTAEETAAMIQGTQLHKLTLEEELFHQQYAKKPDPEDYPGCVRTVDEIKAKLKSRAVPTTGNKPELIKRLRVLEPEAVIYDEIVDGIEKSGKQIITPAAWKTIHGQRDAVMEHEWAGNLLKGGTKEQRQQWKHPRTGMLINFKLDFYDLSANGSKLVVVADLKSCPCSSREAFMWKIYRENLHIQAAIGVDAINDLFGADALWVWLAVESGPPYVVEPHAADFGVLERGRDLYNKMIDRLMYCRENNFWPGYSGGFNVNNIGLPAKAFDEEPNEKWGLDESKEE